MRCTHCGAIIPDDMLRCPECGMEVQIVPDYNPLEDVLAQEVKGSVEDATRQIRTDDIRRYRRDGSREYSNSTRVLSQGELDEIRARRSAAMRQSRQAGRHTAGSMRQTGGERPDLCARVPETRPVPSVRRGRIQAPCKDRLHQRYIHEARRRKNAASRLRVKSVWQRNAVREH